MHMMRRTKVFCGFFFFAISTAFVISLITIVLKNKKTNESYQKITSSIQNIMSSFEANVQIGVMSEGVLLKDAVIKDLENREYMISEVVTSPKLILRYSFTGCEACLKNEFELLETDMRIEKSNVIVILSGGNIRMLKAFNQQNTHFQFFLSENLLIPFDDVGKFYTFMLDSSLIVKDFFIPLQNASRLSKVYYYAIYNKYFKED